MQRVYRRIVQLNFFLTHHRAGKRGCILVIQYVGVRSRDPFGKIEIQHNHISGETGLHIVHGAELSLRPFNSYIRAKQHTEIRLLSLDGFRYDLLKTLNILGGDGVAAPARRLTTAASKVHVAGALQQSIYFILRQGAVTHDYSPSSAVSSSKSSSSISSSFSMIWTANLFPI